MMSAATQLLALWVAASVLPGAVSQAEIYRGEQLLRSSWIVQLSTRAPLTRALDHPSLEIFADGRVVLRRRSTSPRSAMQEARISPPELWFLLYTIREAGLEDFDHRSVREQLIEAQRRREREDGGNPVILDAGTVRLALRLGEENDLGPPAWSPAKEKRIEWTALAKTIEWYPEIEPLRSLQSVIEILRELHDRIDALPDHEAQAEF